MKSRTGEVIALAGISRDLDTPASRGAELGALAGVLDTLHRDCTQPLRIERLAKKSGLSQSQFQRRVRGITGLTPRQLLTKSRIELAAHSLRTFGSGFVRNRLRLRLLRPGRLQPPIPRRDRSHTKRIPEQFPQSVDTSKHPVEN